MKRKRERAILDELRDIEGDLSPENLSWDGERDPREVKRESLRLSRKKAILIKELGREPSFEELCS